MDQQQITELSKFMSLVLRHQPARAGITLDTAGWVAVDELLAGINSRGKTISRQQLETVVRENNKQRFQFNEDETQIRATQGHSINIDLGYEPSTPPQVLYHGTPEKFVASIRDEGLTKQQRHHVHLHTDAKLASDVGQRRGKPVVLIIDAGFMATEGHEFLMTPNGVWLTDHVPPNFIRFSS